MQGILQSTKRNFILDFLQVSGFLLFYKSSYTRMLS